MIQRLLIKNYAIIESLEIEFSKGLTIITGETGAGKSILLGGLGMILGNRADTKVLYNATEKCVIEGYFDISAYNLQSFFDEHEIDYDTQTVVRRELTPAGKTRAFINDTPVNLAQLRAFSGKLVDLHQQFDTLDIHDASFQLQMIDALAGNKHPLSIYTEKYRVFQSDKKRLAQLIEKNERSAREIDFLNFQLDEFNKAELIEGEQETLEADQQRLQNAETIKRNLSAAYQAISEDENAIVGQMRSISASISQVKKYTPSVSKLYERFESLLFELEDIGGELESIAEDTEYDPERIAEIQTRLDTIYKLEKKHGVATVEQLLSIQDDLQKQLDAFGDLSEEIETLQQDLAQQEEVLKKLANELSAKRKFVVPQFEEKVEAMLRQLSMENAKLKVQTIDLDDLTPTGMDDVQFLFAANKGSRMMPIKDVASGGELSRLALCTKSLVASAIPLPTLIFDEIDSGVSGDVALKMGNILQSLASHHQVVVITHAPQVAAKADKHYFVYKNHTTDRTLTSVRPLSKEDRIKAIAVMLSQNPPSASALANAKELLTAN
ncbi:MAG: DNA repair protein RecN [Saprospiraceae bacterium]|nr:DNA repair protein RecN [Saprospiraceae bacterium]